MSSQPYSPQGQEIQLDITSYTAAQPTGGNPSQSLNFLPYEPNSLSPTVSYTESSHGYGGRLDFSNASSPVHSHRPVPSPLLQSTFFAPSHPETISPTALYQHQASSGTFTADSHGGRHRSYSHPHPHPRAASQSQSQSQSHAREIFRTESPAPHPSYHQHSLSQDYLLPDPHATRPQLSISVSSGVVGHSEGWSDSTVPLSDTPDRLPTDPTPSPRSRATSLMGKKKKASPRTGVVPLPARKRSPASCAPCRKKKLKCDRSLPCSSCVAKGTECIWQGDATPLYIKDEHDQRGTKELQAQVDRLQALVDDLASSPKSSKTSFKLDSTTGSEVHSLDPSPTFELLAHDLAQGLVEVAFEGVLPQQQSAELSFSPDGRSGAAFIDEARHFSKSRSRPTPLTSLVTPSTSSSEGSPSSSGFPPLRNFALPALQSSYSRGRQSVAGLLESVPAFNDIDIASNHFFGTVDLLVPLVIRSKFEQARDALRRAVEDKSDLGPIPIALVLAVASAGLSKMTELEALERGMAGDRKAMVGKWLDLAVSALSLARFPESPTFDGIRTALIVASLQLTGNYGDDVRAYPSAISLLSSAAQAAFALELHREPNRNGRTKYRFSECQERRRLFWGLFAVCSSVTTDTCRPWPQFDLRYIDTHFPLDCFDEELSMDELAIRASVRARVNSETFEETPMTFNLCLARLAFVSKKISDEAFAVGGCHHPKIAVLFSELRKFEESLPECYRVPFDQEERASFSPRSSLATNLKAALVQASISSEIVRLNRPFLVLAASDEKYHRSRERAVTHAKRVLSIATDPSCQRIVPELLPKTLSAAIVVGIELIQAPEEFDVKLLQALFKASSELMAQYSRTSIIAAQGANVLRFLHKHMSVSASSSASGYRAKWPRSSRDVPHEGTLQPRQTWLHSVPNSMYPSRAGSPGSDSEVLLVSRKANRPALKHSARSESHLSSRARFVPRPLLPERSHRSHSAEDFPSFTIPTLPLSPTTSSTSAPSIAAFSPILDSEASRYSHHQPSRDRTFSGPASSLHLTDLSVGAFPAQSTVFRYYQHPSGSNRASFSANPGPPDSGLGIIDFAHHGNHPLPTSPAYEEDDPFQPHVGERMETEDLRFEHSVVEDYAFASTYRHS